MTSLEIKKELLDRGWEEFKQAKTLITQIAEYEFTAHIRKNDVLLSVYDTETDNDDYISFFVDSLDRIKAVIYGITGLDI